MGGVVSLLLFGALGWFLWQRRPGQGDGVEEVLADAERAGIITAEQHRAILSRARPSGPASQLSGVTWLAILAGLFVLAGISLLIATNWENIGPAVRMAGFLLLLLAAGESAIRAQTLGLAISLELVWLVLPLLGIGLYAQTFQLSGETITPFLVWLALGVPLAWRSGHAIVPALHTGALTVTVLMGSFFVPGPLYLQQAFDPGAWALSVSGLALVVVQSLRLLPAGQRHHCFGVVAAWTLGILATAPPFGLEHGGWLAVAAIALATLWILGLLEVDADAGELVTAVTVWLGILYAITFTWHSDGSLAGSTTQPAIVATLIIAGLTVLGLVRAPPRRLGTHAGAARLILVLPLALSFLLLFGEAAVFLAAVLANLLLVVIASAMMWHGSTERAPAEINFGISVLLLVLVTRFFDVFGSFVQSGVGFIVAGVLLAALAYGLERTRRRLVGDSGAEAPR